MGQAIELVTGKDYSEFDGDFRLWLIDQAEI